MDRTLPACIIDRDNSNKVIWMRALLTALAVPAVLILAAFPPAAVGNQADGRMMLTLVRIEDRIEITSVSVFPGAAPSAKSAGSHQWTITSADGGKLASGRVEIPRFIVQERVDENGDFFGRAEPFAGPLTLVLPYYRNAGRLVLRSGGRIVMEHNLAGIEPFVRRASVTSDGLKPNPPDFRGYLKELEARRGAGGNKSHESMPAAVDSSAVKQTVKGRIKVVGIKDYSKIRAVVSFHRIGKEESSVEALSDDEGGFTVKLEPAKYLVMASCYYKDPAFGGQEVLLYPNPMIVSDFNPRAGSLKLKWRLNRLFRGRLVIEGGGSTAGKVYVLERKHSGSAYQPYYVARIDTNAKGRFALRLPPRAFVMIALPNPQEPAGELLTIVNVPKESRLWQRLVCPRIGDVSGADLKKIWDAGPERTKLNLVFMAEAYTSGMESFSDANGNGIWDGDLLLDENGNGNLDEGEHYNDRNRNGVYDAPESFVDLNGDRICNRFERAKFEADAALAAAAVLSFHPFNDYADAINVYTWWISSEHGTQQFTGARPWRNMNTYFGAYCYGTGGFQSSSINRAAKAEAMQLLPNAGEIVPVVLVHDPFDALRANANFNFGRILLSAEDSRAGAVLIHELGHSVGNLADEYIYENAGRGPSCEPTEANITIVTDPAGAKWAQFIRGNPPVPTPDWYDGYGLFEGAWFYSYGVYRPTGNSMMRSTSYPFFEVNAGQLDKVLAEFR